MSQNSQPLTPTLFDASDYANWKQFLDDNGFVVLKNILTTEEYDSAFDIFKKDINKVSPNFDFNKTETQTINTCPAMYGKGMAVFNGFGQSDGMWTLRTNNKILDIFKKIHQTEALVTSLDGFSIFVSKEQKSKSWLHIDQNPKNEIYSIQSSYNFLPVNSKDDAGFVLVPESHKNYTPEVSHLKDWIVCDPQPVDQSRKLIIPANCLTLWNSKTIHANEGMSKTNTKRGLNRLTCYITYLPKEKRSEEVKKKRINAYLTASTTSHWSNKCELKRYPYGFKSRYESRGFSKITPTFEPVREDNVLKMIIPSKRLNLL